MKGVDERRISDQPQAFSASDIQIYAFRMAHSQRPAVVRIFLTVYVHQAIFFPTPGIIRKLLSPFCCLVESLIIMFFPICSHGSFSYLTHTPYCNFIVIQHRL